MEYIKNEGFDEVIGFLLLRVSNQFFQSLGWFKDIESKLRRIEEDPEGAGTTHLYESIQGVGSPTNRAFESLFERQVQAEKIRYVQGMLQRFRTLFNLPSTIRGSINKGEYDLAVREYMKAKSIVPPSHDGPPPFYLNPFLKS